MDHENKIYFNSRQNEFLSNFYICPMQYSDRTWQSAEHAYQAMKSPFHNVQNWVGQAPTPAEAKKRGRQIEVRKDWDEELKLYFMEDILNWKFLHPELKQMLIETGDKELIEYAPWEKSNNPFWGVNKSLEGQNHLGKLLMKIRNRL